MSAAAKKLSAATLLARHAAAGAVLTLVLAGCSSRLEFMNLFRAMIYL